MGDRYGFEAEHLVVQPNFNPEVGFLHRADFRRTFGMFPFSPRPAESTAIRKYQFEAAFNHYFTNSEGRIETQQAQAQAGMDLQSGDEWRVEVRNSYEYLDEPFESPTGWSCRSAATGSTRSRRGHRRAPAQSQRLVLGRRRPVLRR